MGSRPLPCPLPSFLSSPPAHLSIISSLDLRSPQPPFSPPPRVLGLLLLLLSSAFYLTSPSSFPLSLLLAHLISPLHLPSSRFLFLSLPNLSLQRCFHYSLSVCPLCHPHTHTHHHHHAHTHSNTHTLSSYFPSAWAPFDLSKCSHRTSIDLCIQMQCVCVRVCVALFTLLNVTCSLASRVPFRARVWVCALVTGKKARVNVVCTMLVC